MHDQHVVVLRNQVIREVGLGSIAVFGALLVDDFLDKSSVRDDNRGARAQLNGVQAAILLRPFRESRLVIISK